MMRFSRKGISVSAVLDRRRMKRNGMYPVKIEVVWQRKQKYFKTGVDMSEQDWIKMTGARSRTVRDVADIEECFSRIRNEVADMIEKNCFSFKNLEMRFGCRTRLNVNMSMKHMMDICLKEDRINSFYRIRSTLSALERYAGEDIPFNSVNASWLKNCEYHWINEGKSPTTVCIYMKTLKMVMNKAMYEGYIGSYSNPFGRGGYTIPKGNVRKLALSKIHIKKLMEYRGPDKLEEYRDLWLFSYLCNGINFKDMLFLKYKNIVDGEICFVRSKTKHAYGKGKIIHAVLCPKMEEIIARWGNACVSADTYIFRFADGSEDSLEAEMLVRKVICQCNTALKKIAEEIGIPIFTTYAARHSFATVMQKSGAELSFISECLGHSSLSVTKTYLAGSGREERIRNSVLLTDFD